MILHFRTVSNYAVAQEDVDVQHDVHVDEHEEDEEDEQVDPKAISAKST
nr:hypothetical protein [Ancrocorticia populi]